MKDVQIYTIGRQFGSGGLSIGKELAEKLGIPCYDKELITKAAEQSGLSKELVQYYDEKHSSSLLYSIVMNTQNANWFGNSKPIEAMVMDAQIEALKNVAQKGSCVIVGRCADYILKDNFNVVSFFITASMSFRIAHVMEREKISEKGAQQKIKLLDKTRASYYRTTTDREWGMAKNYNLCIDRSNLETPTVVELILKYLSL